MIYLDSSIVLANLFLEERRPSPGFWRQPATSSRLLVYEVWNRVFARDLGELLQDEVWAALRKVSVIEFGPVSLERALAPFPVAVRTLDALHLATMDFLRRQGQSVELASYDNRLLAAAASLGIPLATM